MLGSSQPHIVRYTTLVKYSQLFSCSIYWVAPFVPPDARERRIAVLPVAERETATGVDMTFKHRFGNKRVLMLAT
jgi:hypothetical protein